MSSAAHEFHTLWYGLGPHGPQDVHVHPCSKDGHGPNDDGPKAGCSEVLLGYDRDRCTGRIEFHERANLDDEASVKRAADRLRATRLAMPTQAQTLEWMRRRWPERTDPIWRALKLGEEAGEVQGAVIKMDEGRKTLADLSTETAQLVICAMALAESAGFDLEAAIATEWARCGGNAR